MNLPARSRSRRPRSRARGIARLRVLARERAEHELRHRHVGGRVDPVAGDVAEHDREPAVGELEEVVDVAADVDAAPPTRRPRRPRAPARPALARQQRPLDRLRERLLLLVEAGVVDRERRLRGDLSRRCDPSPLIGLGRFERDNRQLRERLGRRDDREHGRGRALDEETARATHAHRRACVQTPGRERACVVTGQPDGLGTVEQVRTASLSRPSATWNGPRHHHVSPLVRQADHRGIDPEDVDDRRRVIACNVVSRERLLREGARDLVEQYVTSR